MAFVLTKTARWAAVVISGLLLVGCGDGSSDDGTTSSTPTSDSSSSAPSTSQSTDLTTGSNAVVQGKVVLSWSAPLTRQNGDSISLSQLDKYLIRYGQDEDNLTEQVVVEDAANLKGGEGNSYTIDGLSEGTWYFTVQAQDSDGLMSPPSEMVNKNFPS